MVTSGLCSPGKAKVRRLLETAAEDDWALGTEPLTITDGELKRELIEIGQLSADSKNQEWMKRVKALQRFKGLMAGGSYDSANFLLWMREYMKDQLNQAIQDLRSAVSKEACLSVMCLCKYLPPNLWEPMGDWFLNSLFKISVVTIAIISQSSARCLRYIITHGKITQKTLSAVLDPVNFENKHSTYRQTVYQVMFIVVHRVQAIDYTSRQFDFLVRAVKQGLNDPMPEVRRVARLLFWALHAKHPVRSDSLFGQLDPVAQKNVSDDSDLYDSLPNYLEVDWDLVAKEQSLRRPSALSNSGEGNSPTKKSAMRSHSAQNQREPLTVPAKLVASRQQRAANRSQTPLPSAPSQQGQQNPALRSSPRVARPGGKRALRGKDVNSQTSTNSNQYHPPSVGSTDGGISSEAQETEEDPQPQQLPHTQPASDLRDITVEQAIAMGQSNDSANKVKCLEAFTQMAPTSAFRLVRAKLPSVMLSVLTLLRDSNLLVSTAAINTCSAFAEALQDSAMLEPYFERIFLVLFTKLGNSRTHQAAVSLLEKLLECGQTRVLFPILLKVLDSANTQVQLGCLEYLLHLMNFSHEYLRRSANMRQGISRFLYLANSANQDVRKASCTCLTVLHSVSTAIFTDEVAALSSADQLNVCKIIPSLGDELKTREQNAPPRVAPAKRTPSKHAPPKQLNAELLSQVEEVPTSVPVKSPVRKVSKPVTRQGAGTPTSALRSASQGDKARKATTPVNGRRPVSPGLASLHTGHWGTVTNGSSSEPEKISSIRKILNDRIPWPPLQDLAAYLTRTSGSSSASLISCFTDDLLGKELRLSLMELGKAIVLKLSQAGNSTALVEYFRGVLKCYCDPEPTVSDHVEDVLHCLVMEADVKEVVDVVSLELSRRGPASMQEEIPLLFKLLERATMQLGAESASDLATKAGFFTKSLYNGFKSERAEVRKAVVFNFVALYLTLGSSCVDLLKPLSTSQLKLITIYVNRKLGKNDVDLLHLQQ